MTKTEVASAIATSRVTVDKILNNKDDKRRDLVIFLLTTSLFDYNDKIKRIKNS